MNNKQQVSGLIRKYALVMIGTYLIHFGFQALNNFYLKEAFYENRNSVWIPVMMLSSGLILNLVAALFVASDVRKYQPKSKYLILLTIVYRPLGVCLLLISLVLKSDEE